MVENQQILGTKGKKVRTFGAPELDDGVDEALVEVGRPSEPRLRVRREYQAGAVCVLRWNQSFRLLSFAINARLFLFLTASSLFHRVQYKKGGSFRASASRSRRNSRPDRCALLESAFDLAGTMASGRYMAYSPSPSTAPQSPHISGMRSASSALVEQEK
ncbi:hypothetical protein GW17_00010059 [Ensete ventricosum]|nr:hypothetical protein GW17_00010059 [Ensete ventricosum]RZS02477.1 hypothetical protein BHM03_00032530 [Ensete ventricosum]